MNGEDKLGLSGVDLQLKGPISGLWGSWLISESCVKGQSGEYNNKYKSTNQQI